MCPIKQAFCRRNPLKAISKSMHGPVKFVYIFETFPSDFIDFYVNKKKTSKPIIIFFFSVFFIFDMPRIPQNF